MRDIYTDVKQWSGEGQKIALATVIKTWGASPRTEGAKMAVNQHGDITGSVSGGCVEGAVAAACQETLQHGEPQLLHFDVADDTAWGVGLGCGGELDVYVRLLSQDILAAFDRAVDQDQSLALATVLPEDQAGSEFALFTDGKGEAGFQDDQILDLTRSQLASNKCGLHTLKDGSQVFVDVMPSPPLLVIVGGVHIAVALVTIARASGFQTMIIDPRRQFGTVARFPEAGEIIHKWPDEAFESIRLDQNTAVAVLTHDPKIDDPALMAALPSEAYYVGALGSRKTQAARRDRLLESGLQPELLDRLHGPIGLDLGGRSPEEIALAVMAEVVQERYRVQE
jgi:xanthine dehydrogenase accessory factor